MGAILIATGGGNLVAAGGGNLVAAGGGNVVSTNGGNLVAAGGGNLVAAGGGNLVAQGGGNVVSTNGGNLVSQGGGNAPVDSLFVNPANSSPVHTAGDLQTGSQGWFVAGSTGGSAPTVTVTTNRDGTMTGTLTVTFDQTSSPRIQDLQGLAFTVVANPAVVKLASSNVVVSEGAGHATVTVTRTGDTTTTVTVSYATSDGTATERTDFMPVYGTVTFNAGETQKTIDIPLVDNGYGPSSGAQRSFSLTIGNTIGGVMQMPNVATVSINNNDTTNSTTSPADGAQFFVRQHYLDFLGREPDQGGFDFWVSQITQCGTDQACIRAKRIDVSNAFFFELEYQQTASYVLRLYRAAYGNHQPSANPDSSNPTEANKVPSYAAFAPDRAQVVGGSALAQSQLAIATDFAFRPAFLAKYAATMSGPDFVDAVLATIKNDTGVDLNSQRTALIAEFNTGGRGQVLYRLADDNVQGNPINNRAFIDAEYNRSFVTSQYFGYLRRDADIGGFLFWLGQVSSAPLRNVPKQHAMVCSFVTSAEYQLRFSAVITHSNSECAQ